MAGGPKNPFDDPTRARAVPRPGLGRAGAPEAEAAPPPLRTPPLPSSASAAPGPAGGGELREFQPRGANRIISIATPLFALIGRLRGTASMPNVPQVRQQAVRAVRAFDERIATLGYPQDIQMPARYVLCSAIDQAVLSTPWGAQSEWASQGMLITFHREAWGGKKFFEILDRALTDPHRYIDLLEVQYLCLSLGFAGKYQEDPQGPARLLELRDDLYRRIRDVRGTPPQALSVQWEGERDRRNRVARYLPLWVVAALAATLVFAVFLVYRLQLYSTAHVIDDRFAQLGTEKPQYVSAAAQVAPTASTVVRTLRSELREQENARELSIEDTDKGALVSLVGEGLFASGSAAVNSRRVDTLRRVGAALDSVPGRVLVLGHTDDQPIRSFRFSDNVELSRARASSVRQLLATAMSEPGRIATVGLGSTAPRYEPADLPENRARNRRVEILVQRE